MANKIYVRDKNMITNEKHFLRKCNEQRKWFSYSYERDQNLICIKCFFFVNILSNKYYAMYVRDENHDMQRVLFFHIYNEQQMQFPYIYVIDDIMIRNKCFFSNGIPKYIKEMKICSLGQLVMTENKPLGTVQ